MDDFLKDRPVIKPGETRIIGAEPKANISLVDSTGASPFAEIRGVAPARPPGGVATTKPPATAEPQTIAGENGARVQTIVERGRVMKIIVTCACGKTTEIACQY